MDVDKQVATTAWNTLLIVVGWAIVHWLSARRDRDKARRDLVVKAADSLAVVVDDLASNAFTYHTSQRDVALERRLKMKLQDLALQLGELREPSRANAECSACQATVVGLRKAITTHHFEDDHLGPLDGSESQLDAIASAILEVKRRLARLKLKQFPD